MTPVLVGFIDSRGALEARFDDGYSVMLHSSTTGRFWVMRPFETDFRGDAPLAPVQELQYQRAALRAFLGCARHKVSVSPAALLAEVAQ